MPCDTTQGHPSAVLSESGKGSWREGVGALRHRDRKDGASDPVCSMAFTERTRADGRNLETLTETSYALCNPGNGGRAQSRQVLAPYLTKNDGKQSDNSDTGAGPTLIAEDTMVRRLTPRECERLQGLPDDYTLVPYRGTLAKDAPRYRALGNTFAVPVVRWIGERIRQVEDTP